MYSQVIHVKNQNQTGPENRRILVLYGKVEMAGIEPASERFDPRISTSVVTFLFS